MRQPPHDAEVDEADPVAGHGQQVARVGVGVEHALDQRHVEEGVRAPLRELRLVEPALVQAHGIIEEHALHELLHQHAFGRHLPVDLGEDDVLAVGEQGRQQLAVAGLV